MEELRLRLLETGGTEQLDASRYMSSLDNSPIAGGPANLGPQNFRGNKVLEAMAAGGGQTARLSTTTTTGPTPAKQKRRRNVHRSRRAAGAGTGTVYGLALGESIDISLIEKRWEEKFDTILWSNPTNGGEKTSLISSVVSIEKQVSYWKIFDENLDCFVFAFGCIVVWDATETQLNLIIERVSEFVTRPLDEIKRDKVVYTSAADRIEQANNQFRDNAFIGGGYGGASADEGDVPPLVASEQNGARLKPKIVYGNVQLTSVNSFEKLAYSYSIAQSVRLDVFEDDISNAISATSDIPIHLAKKGTVGMSNRAVTIKMGELFLQRSNVNLHSDILDTPELFWEFDEYEQMYILGREYLDIDKRIEILNQRLDIMKDLYEMLQNELNIKHSAKIEIIIIVLILAEVVLQVLGLVISWLTGITPLER